MSDRAVIIFKDSDEPLFKNTSSLELLNLELKSSNTGNSLLKSDDINSSIVIDNCDIKKTLNFSFANVSYVKCSKNLIEIDEFIRLENIKNLDMHNYNIFTSYSIGSDFERNENIIEIISSDITRFDCTLEFRIEENLSSGNNFNSFLFESSFAKDLNITNNINYYTHIGKDYSELITDNFIINSPLMGTIAFFGGARSGSGTVYVGNIEVSNLYIKSDTSTWALLCNTEVYGASGVSNQITGLWSGGNNSNISKILFNIQATATIFGSIDSSILYASHGNHVYGIWAGGQNNRDEIEKVTIDIESNTSLYGYITTNKNFSCCTGKDENALFISGQLLSGIWTSSIEKKDMYNNNNSYFINNLTTDISSSSACGDKKVYGFIFGGLNINIYLNTIDRLQLDGSTTNTNYANLSENKYYLSSTSNETCAIISGGIPYPQISSFETRLLELYSFYTLSQNAVYVGLTGSLYNGETEMGYSHQGGITGI